MQIAIYARRREKDRHKRSWRWSKYKGDHDLSDEIHGKAVHQRSSEERNPCETVKLIVIGNERNIGV